MHLPNYTLFAYFFGTHKIFALKLQMEKLDELGCQSIWIGFCGAQPQRLYSPQMADLAGDETLTNFVVSAMVNKLGKYDWFTMAIVYQAVNCKSKMIISLYLYF